MKNLIFHILRWYPNGGNIEVLICRSAEYWSGVDSNRCACRPVWGESNRLLQPRKLTLFIRYIVSTTRDLNYSHILKKQRNWNNRKELFMLQRALRFLMFIIIFCVICDGRWHWGMWKINLGAREHGRRSGGWGGGVQMSALFSWALYQARAATVLSGEIKSTFIQVARRNRWSLHFSVEKLYYENCEKK